MEGRGRVSSLLPVSKVPSGSCSPRCSPPRSRYQDPAFLRALHAATQLLYRPESPVRERLVPLPVVHMMLAQHSLFLPTLLASGEEGAPDSQVKGEETSPSPRGRSPTHLLLGSAEGEGTCLSGPGPREVTPGSGQALPTAQSRSRPRS